ncbi:hypothetical protein BKA62DRAFT_776032 [Auriculariales sp. MPI-PUGE-AT-0066]|nr:hypothetical protein BKA62DRAFT_776032 [Auriculariales sp. MPI-PUGE-AT-0066]
MNGEGTNTEQASLALALRSWMFIRWPFRSAFPPIALKATHLFDLHILQKMVWSRYFISNNGYMKKAATVYAGVLSDRLNWKMSWGVDTQTPVQPIQPATLDLLLSEITSSMEMAEMLDDKFWQIPAIAAIAPPSQWTVPRLRILAQIALKKLELQLRPRFNSRHELNLRSEWESISLDIVDPWYVSGLTAWGFAIEQEAQLNISKDTVKWLAYGFNLLLKCASSQPHPTLQQAERCLSCISSSVVAGWDGQLISSCGVLKLLQHTPVDSTYWSAKLGHMMFEIARQLQRCKDATLHIAELAQVLVPKIEYGHKRRLRLNQTVHEHVTAGVLNLLPPPARLM